MPPSGEVNVATARPRVGGRKGGRESSRHHIRLGRYGLTPARPCARSRPTALSTEGDAGGNDGRSPRAGGASPPRHRPLQPRMDADEGSEPRSGRGRPLRACVGVPLDARRRDGREPRAQRVAVLARVRRARQAGARAPPRPALPRAVRVGSGRDRGVRPAVRLRGARARARRRRGRRGGAGVARARPRRGREDRPTRTTGLSSGRTSPRSADRARRACRTDRGRRTGRSPRGGACPSG